MSNALDAASLIMVPSGYENGTLGSVKPTDGTGDFTFTRGAGDTCTRVNADGYIEKGYENLLLQSNSFTTSPWSSLRASLTSSQEGYDGTNDAWLLESTSFGQTKIQVSNSASGVNTISFYAKAGTANYAVPYMTSTSARAWFNLSNGTIESSFNNIDASIESVGNGWYRCSMAFAGSAANTWILACPTNNVLNSEIGDNIHIQDAMINQGLVAYPYIETTTAPVAGGILEDMPRLDYSNGSCPALLLEPSRTNLITQSEYFSNAFSFTNSSVVYNDIISPENLLNAAKYIATGTSFNWASRIILTQTNEKYALSIFGKKGDTNVLCFTYYDAGIGQDIYFNYDLENGVILNAPTSSPAYVDASITDFGNGWYRCAAIINSQSGGTNSFFQFNLGTNRISPAANSYIYVWGAQLEQDATYETSYIPTYGVSQTRLRDAIDYNIIEPLSNSQGTLLINLNSQLNTLFSFAFLLNNDGATYVRVDNVSNNRLRVLVRLNSVFPFSQTINGGFTAGQDFKVILRYNENKVDLFVDGEKKIDGAGTWLLPSLNTLTWNARGTETKQLLVFPTALTDSECIGLTTI